MASSRRSSRRRAAEPAPSAADAFDVLGVPPTASRREVTEAYRAKAQLHHPDRHLNSSPRRRREAERSMRELNEAYRLARARRPAAAYKGTNTVPNAALWLGTAPGSWARTAKRSGPTGPVTEEERRLSRQQIAQAAAEHVARTRVVREIRLEADQRAGVGQARGRAKPRSAHGQQVKVLAGLGQALATGQIRCTRCRSLQGLPPGWQHHLDDTAYFCSGCDGVLLAR